MGRLQAGGVSRFKLIARQRSLALWFAGELGNQGLEFDMSDMRARRVMI